MKQVTTVGIDLAKNVFTLHGVDAAGHVLRSAREGDGAGGGVAALFDWDGGMHRRA